MLSVGLDLQLPAAPSQFSRMSRARRFAAELASGSHRELVRALLRGTSHKRPIFVVGVPRSGTTTLLVILAASQELGSAVGESHAVWLLFHHPRYVGWDSAAIGTGAVRRFERRLVDAYFASHSGGRRLLDKTPANSLRLPHILELFPDATIVVMRRNPCDTINSLIKGWRHPASQFGTFVLPQDLRIPDYGHRRLWCFALPPGWREVIGKPLAEVAFMQWERICAAIEAARGRAPASSRWVDVHLEDFLERPAQALEAMCADIGISLDARLQDTLLRVRNSPVNALTRGGVGKWRGEHPDEIAPLLPRIAAASEGRGYKVDASTGQFVIARSERTSLA